MVLNLESLVQHMFVRMFSRPDAESESSGTGAILGVTFLAMLFNTTYLVRLLCVAVTQAFSPGNAEDLALAALLQDSTRLGMDERLLVLCNDLMAMALYPDHDSDTDGERDDAAGAPLSWEEELALASRDLGTVHDALAADGEMPRYAW